MICEFGDCMNEAVSAYSMADEDQATYETYRCADHPVTDLDYTEVAL